MTLKNEVLQGEVVMSVQYWIFNIGYTSQAEIIPYHRISVHVAP